MTTSNKILCAGVAICLLGLTSVSGQGLNATNRLPTKLDSAIVIPSLGEIKPAITAPGQGSICPVVKKNVAMRPVGVISERQTAEPATTPATILQPAKKVNP